MKLQIQNLKELENAANRKMAVIVPKSRAWNMPRPAAFLIHLPGIQLLKLFSIGMFIYEKSKPKGNKP